MKKKIIFILGFIIIGIICTTIGVYAVTSYQANEISYKDTTVDQALDNLYTKANSTKKLEFCSLESEQYGTKGHVGAKYKCNLGDNIDRYFYILTVNTDNTVDMIMDRNITQGTEYAGISKVDAINFFETDAGTIYKNTWKNVINIKLPSGYALAAAVGGNGWKPTTDEKYHICLDTGIKDFTTNPYCYNNGGKEWLRSYLKSCDRYNCEENTSLSGEESSGYWLLEDRENYVGTYIHLAVRVNGDISDASETSNYGVRPVITVLKSNLSSQ